MKLRQTKFRKSKKAEISYSFKWGKSHKDSPKLYLTFSVNFNIIE